MHLQNLPAADYPFPLAVDIDNPGYFPPSLGYFGLFKTKSAGRCIGTLTCIVYVWPLAGFGHVCFCLLFWKVSQWYPDVRSHDHGPTIVRTAVKYMPNLFQQILQAVRLGLVQLPDIGPIWFQIIEQIFLKRYETTMEGLAKHCMTFIYITTHNDKTNGITYLAN